MAGDRFGRDLNKAFTEGDFANAKGKLKMKTKLQVSKNVAMNKPDEKRQGMKVRTVVTGHEPRAGLFLCGTSKSMGRPSLA
jgi:hypothetical protein